VGRMKMKMGESSIMNKVPSFQFYPGDWHGTKWFKYRPMSLTIKPLPGCYVIYLDGALSYIGQSSNVRKRISNHRLRYGYGAGVITPWGQFSDCCIKVRYSTKYGDWAMRELRLIRKLRPCLNCVGSTRKRATT